jgi:hypothetical protein
MAMNCVDELLSNTADAFETGLNTENREMLEALLTQGNTPGVIREINSMPGVELVIQVKRR